MNKYTLIFLLCFLFQGCSDNKDRFWIEMEMAEPGSLVQTEWHGEPVAVLFLTDEMISEIKTKYRDKGISVGKMFRSVKPEYFVFFDISKNIEKRIKFIASGKRQGLMNPETGEVYDFTGRTNDGKLLKIPNYKFESDTKMVFHE